MKKTDSIYNEDCFETLSGLEDESVDLIVSSPPYNIGKEYEKRSALASYLGVQSALFQEFFRVLKPTGSIFWQVGVYTDGPYHYPLDIMTYPSFCEAGFKPVNRIVWIRQHGMHARRKFSGRHETIMWYCKTPGYKFNLDNIRVPQKYQGKTSHREDNYGELTCNPDGKNPGDIWAFRNVKHNHEEQTIHPCQFPEDLIARIVLASTDPGDVVYDPYMGSGTVAVVSRDYDRRYIGSETDESYFEVSLRRAAGMPNEEGSFANLKCLRSYSEKYGLKSGNYTFDLRGQSNKAINLAKRIRPEADHLQELYDRTDLEETFFGDQRRGLNPDPTLLADQNHPQGRPKSIDKPSAKTAQISLLNHIESA
jgi:adenine-specific DNA-methyltransferase